GASPLNKSCERRERNRISPIHKNSGRAVKVQLEAAPQMVMAMASPAGRLENSSMPSQAAPASVRPTHTPPARNPKMDNTNSEITSASFIACFFFAVRFFGNAAHAPYGFVQYGNKENQGAYSHGDLRYPQRGGVVAG